MSRNVQLRTAHCLRQVGRLRPAAATSARYPITWVSPKVRKAGKAGKSGKGGTALAVVSIALDVRDRPAVREFLHNAPSQVLL